MKKFFSCLSLLGLLSGLLTGCMKASSNHKVPEAPPCHVQLEKNGKSYEVCAVQGQVWLLFKPSVSPQQAELILAQNNARILDKQPEVGYYIVEIKVGTESAFVAAMRHRPEVYYVYPNALYEPLSLTVPCVIDFFYKSDHGRMVAEMMANESKLKIEKSNQHDISVKIFEDWKLTSDDKKRLAFNRILNLNDYTNPNNLSVVINMSLGPNTSADWDDAKLSNEEKQAYIEACIDEMVGQVKYLYSYYNPNGPTRYNCVNDFVITKAAGNAGMKNKEIIFEGIYNELTSEEWDFFKKHYIFVSAKDNYRDSDYPDDVYNGYGYHELLSKVDISDKTNQRKINWHGTSFAAPRLAGYIVRAANEYDLQAIEVLPYVRRATRKAFEQVIDYEMLAAEISGYEKHADNKETTTKLLETTRSSIGITYVYEIPSDPSWFNSGKTFSIQLPNGWCTVKYQYLYDDNYVGCKYSCLKPPTEDGFRAYYSESFLNNKYLHDGIQYYVEKENDHIFYGEPMHYIAFWTESAGSEGERAIGCVFTARREGSGEDEWWECVHNGYYRLCHADIMYESMGLSPNNRAPIIMSFFFHD